MSSFIAIHLSWGLMLNTGPRLADSGAPGIPLSLFSSVMRLQLHSATSDIDAGAGVLNCGPHACETSTLRVEPPPHPTILGHANHQMEPSVPELLVS